MFCPNCGKQVQEGIPFCSECGAKMGVDAIQAAKAIAAEIKRGFLLPLFDFSFKEFFTRKIIKFLFGLGIFFFAGLSTIGILIYGIVFLEFSTTRGIGILMIILSPFYFLMLAISFRVGLEVILVLFRIEDHIKNIAKQGQQES